MSILKPAFKSWGGVHPAYRKELSASSPIQPMPLPPLLRVSMAQHLGAPAQPTVKKGDTVRKGQRIGEAAGFISAHVHAPTSGTVKAVAEASTASGGMAAAVDIEPDGEDAWDPALAGRPDWENLSPRELREAIADAGIAGMGGAGFPTHVKLSPPPDKPIDTLIVNGAECEPYLTADDRLMIERAADLWQGCRILRRILAAGTVRIAIETNKPDALAAVAEALKGADGDVAVVALPSEYPQGAEKQQIFSITGREVPSGGLPMDVGCVVENVGTVLAAWDAVVNGRPLIERVTTVTGTPVRTPRNVLNRLGTPYAALLDFCGGSEREPCKVISGGPMMGLAQHSLDVTTTKTTSGLTFLAPDEVAEYTNQPCIGCGRCVDACPMNLMPSELSQMLEAEDYDAADSYDVMDCIECGCCAFQCPAMRPLVQHMRRGKSHVALKRRQQQQQKEKAS